MLEAYQVFGVVIRDIAMFYANINTKYFFGTSNIYFYSNFCFSCFLLVCSFLSSLLFIFVFLFLFFFVGLNYNGSFHELDKSISSP